MKIVRVGLARLSGMLSRESRDRDFSEELASLIRLHMDDNLRRGMTPEEALRTAKLDLGSVESIKEGVRERQGFPVLESVAQDIRYALRSMRRSPGFATVAVMTLAVGIGINAAVFTVANASLFRGFPNIDPDNRVIYIETSRFGATSYPDYEDWKAQARSFDGMGIVQDGARRLIVSDDGRARAAYDGTVLSANSFEVLKGKPILGRDFAPSDETPGAVPAAILSYRFWESRYSKDGSIVGRTIRIDDKPTTVIGVMPAGFEFPHHRVDLWLPLVMTPDILKRENRRFFFAYARMSDGVTIRSAQAELAAIGRRLENAYPSTNRGFRPIAKTFRDRFIGRHAAALYGSLWGAVCFVLLIACANLASFLLSRAAGRAREISVRMALGAAKGRIVRQLLIESIMLSSLGGLAGWFIAAGGVRAYEVLAHSPGDYDRFHYSLDYTVLFYLAAISISAGLLFGLAPAAALSKLDIGAALRDGGHGVTSGARRKRLSTLLIAGEVASAVVLLAGAGVMVRSFLKIYTANPGVNTSDIVTASVLPKASQYPDQQARVALFERIAARLEGVPGVDSLAMADAVPGRNAPQSSFELAGKPQDRPIATAVSIFPGYFRTLGAKVLAGREFNDLDALSAMPVAIVNRQFADRFWPRQDPIGKQFRFFDGPTPEPWRTVVGIASSIVQNDDTGQTFYPVVYVPFPQRPASFVYLLARTNVPPENLETAFERQVRTIDPDLILGTGIYGGNGPAPLSENVLINNWSRGFNAVLFLVFAAIALLLATIGLYAVIAHSISRRTQEIGIRMALGATSRDTRELVFRQGMRPVGAGLAIGLLASFAVNRLLKSELVGISPNDPITLLAVSATLMLAAVLACLIPARRAARIDPAVSLRYE